MKTIETKEIVTFEELYNQSRIDILNIVTFLEQRAYSATCEVMAAIRKELPFDDTDSARDWYEDYVKAREKEKVYNDILDNIASILGRED